MRRLWVSAMVSLAGVLSASMAFADSWTGADDIESLLSYGDGTRIYNFKTTGSNPNSCANTSNIVPHSSLTAAQREELGRILTTAFLAGKSVDVRVSSSQCSTDGYRTYTAVWVK